ncbi:unnamed protein product [Cyclocybe aegerita]|uniref:Uncharacterized protein n=1 Tax=Cyclocybe aegerita TaxID=1973307 RepID=A0A8S0W439_CYCAE|nr:unnamed protein product [Cyclocybe aegerita]
MNLKEPHIRILPWLQATREYIVYKSDPRYDLTLLPRLRARIDILSIVFGQNRNSYIQEVLRPISLFFEDKSTESAGIVDTIVLISGISSLTASTENLSIRRWVGPKLDPIFSDSTKLPALRRVFPVRLTIAWEHDLDEDGYRRARMQAREHLDALFPLLRKSLVELHVSIVDGGAFATLDVGWYDDDDDDDDVVVVVVKEEEDNSE